MIALYIAAASIVAVAVALLVARTPAKLRTADQRGITLQTLIVTAVLVLMAGAAGVVIIAITNNAQDNLEGQSSGIDSRCEPWEIFDPTLDAAGRGGGEGGIGSSASGCVRVCYIRHSQVNLTIDADDDIGAAVGAMSLELALSRADITSTANAATAAEKTTLVVTGNDSLAVKNDDKNATELIKVSTLDIVSSGSTAATSDAYDPNNMVIEVAPNGRYCQIWNTTNDELIVRSRN